MGRVVQGPSIMSQAGQRKRVGAWPAIAQDPTCRMLVAQGFCRTTWLIPHGLLIGSVVSETTCTMFVVAQEWHVMHVADYSGCMRAAHLVYVKDGFSTADSSALPA